MMPCPSKGPRRQQAFTLVELMIVIAIASIMVLLMVPEMQGTYEEAQLRSNARKLANAFRTAYSSAVISHRQHRVRLDPSDAKIIVEARTEDSEIPFVPLKEFDREISQLHKTVAIRFHPPKPSFPGMADESETREADPESHRLEDGVFVFHPDGTCEGQDIELRDRMGFGLLIQLNAITSRVKFQPMERTEK